MKKDLLGARRSLEEGLQWCDAGGRREIAEELEKLCEKEGDAHLRNRPPPAGATVDGGGDVSGDDGRRFWGSAIAGFPKDKEEEEGEEVGRGEDEEGETSPGPPPLLYRKVED